jgi:hypothetical protein
MSSLAITNGRPVVVSCSAFFALKGIYFALLEESGTPSHLTGTTVGLIRFMGEVFMPPLTGWLARDARSDGKVLVGCNRICWILIAFSFLGLLAAVGLRWLRSEPPLEETDD